MNSQASYVGPAVTRREQDGELLGTLDQVDGDGDSIFGAIRGRHSLRREALVGERGYAEFSEGSGKAVHTQSTTCHARAEHACRTKARRDTTARISVVKGR